MYSTYFNKRCFNGKKAEHSGQKEKGGPSSEGAWQLGHRVGENGDELDLISNICLQGVQRAVSVS